MSKNKELEKIKTEKEQFKTEKLEKLEHKEIKEGKPEKEKIEIKEQGKVEIKELEKQFTEKGGKEIAETTQPGSEIERAAVPRQKEVEKIQKDIEKIKTEKEQFKTEKLEKLEHKEIKESKPEKEKIEIKEQGKVEIKELEKQFTEKGGKEIAETTQPGSEIERAAVPRQKEVEKIQKDIEKIKTEKEQFKTEKLEKLEHKEIKEQGKVEIKELEKPITEKGVNAPAETTQSGGEIERAMIRKVPGELEIEKITKLFKGTGTAEERLERLENVVTRLSHFIGVDLRPDLTSGALTQEPDVKTGQSGEESKTAATALRALNSADVAALVNRFRLLPYTARLLVARRPFTSIAQIRGITGLTEAQYAAIEASR